MYNAKEQDKITMVKNWLGRKGLHYLESLTETEKHTCNTLQGLFNTLAMKFKFQFNETIKSLQFRKLYRLEGESAEEWMVRLWIAAVACNDKEVDRQLKEQFIHGLHDRVMLDEIVRELMAKNNSKQTNSEDVLLWARWIEAQRAQAAILNNITEVHKNLTRLNWSKNPRAGEKQKQQDKHIKGIHASTVGEVMHPDSVQHMGKHVPAVGKSVTSRRCA